MKMPIAVQTSGDGPRIQVEWIENVGKIEKGRYWVTMEREGGRYVCSLAWPNRHGWDRVLAYTPALLMPEPWESESADMAFRLVRRDFEAETKAARKRLDMNP